MVSFSVQLQKHPCVLKDDEFTTIYKRSITKLLYSGSRGLRPSPCSWISRVAPSWANVCPTAGADLGNGFARCTMKT